MHAKLPTLLLTCLLANQFCWGAETIIVKHYQTQARYELGIKILDLALSKLNTPYSIQAPAFTESINEARGQAHVIDGLLDLEFMSTTNEREKSMIPIKIPIYRGTLGLRLLLVKKEKQDEIKKIRQLKQLRQYVGGHGKHWGDLPIYTHNELPVVTNVIYDSLFKQLATERFDYFHRGILEIWEELLEHSNELVIADNVMIFYSQPTYFFISKQRPKLALQIEKGLQRAIADGSFKQLFLAHAGHHIERAKLNSRNIIILDNPMLPVDTPPIDMSWWLPKQFQDKITKKQTN